MEKKRGLKTWGVGFLVLVGGLSLVQCGASRLEESGDTQAAKQNSGELIGGVNQSARGAVGLVDTGVNSGTHWVDRGVLRWIDDTPETDGTQTADTPTGAAYTEVPAAGGTEGTPAAPVAAPATATYNLLPGGGSAECEVEDDPAGDGMVDDAFRGRSPDMVGSNYGWVIKGAEASRAAGKNFVNCHPL
jgi:hypothetical protein